MWELIVLVPILVLSAWTTFHTIGTLSPRKNQGWQVKIEEMTKLFNSASDHIHIVTDLSREFFTDSVVLESLREATKRGVHVRIVHDPNGYQLNELVGLQNLIEGGLIEARQAKQSFTRETVRHVMEIDGRWARLETYHPPKQMVHAGADARIYRSPAVAHFAEVEFNRAWELTESQP